MPQNVHDFRKKIESDPELQQKIRALPRDPSAIQGLIKIAGDAGYTISEQDLQEAQKVAFQSGELTEEQLQMVTGGTSITIVIPSFLAQELLGNCWLV